MFLTWVKILGIKLESKNILMNNAYLKIINTYEDVINVQYFASNTMVCFSQTCHPFNVYQNPTISLDLKKELKNSYVLPMIGRGWASVLKTQRSRGISESSENKRYKYFKVSARKKLCCTSSCCTGTLSTSRIPENPTPISQCFLIAWQDMKSKSNYCAHTSNRNVNVQYKNDQSNNVSYIFQPVQLPNPIHDISHRVLFST